MQAHQVEATVHRVGNLEFAEEARFTRTGYQNLVKPLALGLPHSRFPEKIQHRALIRVTGIQAVWSCAAATPYASTRAKRGV